MKSYTKTCVLSIILVTIFCIILASIEVWIEGKYDTAPWAISAICAFCMSSISSIIANIIYKYYYKKYRDKEEYEISNNSKILILLICVFAQIVAMIYACFEAWKRFGNIHPIEYICVAIFALLSANFLKRAFYTLIDKENKK